MYALISIILVLICIFLVIVILVQNPKGGGLGAGFGGQSASAFGGVQRATDFLEKATWGLAIAFLALSLISNVFTPKQNIIDSTQDATIEQYLDDEE